jgi:hypothetical protein
VNESIQHSVVSAVAGFGLPKNGASLRDAGVEPLAVPDDEWEETLNVLSSERLAGLAVAAAEDGILELTHRQASQLGEQQRKRMVWALGLEATLMDLVAELEARGIEAIVLKGPAVAHTAYPEPSWRPFVDLDLLVRTEDWPAALALFGRLGYRRRMPEPHARFDERFGKAATHLTPESQEIDLHRTLALGPFGLWMDPADLFGRTAEFRLGGRRLRRLDDTALLAHACIHAALGMRRSHAMTIRDVPQVAALPGVDWDLMAEWGERWRLSAVIRHASTLASQVTGAAWPEEGRTALSREPDRGERRALRSYTTERRVGGGLAFGTMAAIPGLRAKATYARCLLWPDRAFMAVRNGKGGAGSHLRRLSVPLRWMARRTNRLGRSRSAQTDDALVIARDGEGP